MTVTVRLACRAAAEPPPAPPVPRWSPTAQLLALAHAIERATEDGLAARAHLARCLGLSRARLTQVAALMFLAPDIQEQIATGAVLLCERGLRQAAACADWDRQRAMVRAMVDVSNSAIDIVDSESVSPRHRLSASTKLGGCRSPSQDVGASRAKKSRQTICRER